MNVAMQPAQPPFCAGDNVRETGSELIGQVVAPGVFPGEWRIAFPDGTETICLQENLVRVPRFGPSALKVE